MIVFVLMILATNGWEQVDATMTPEHCMQWATAINETTGLPAMCVQLIAL